MKNMEYNPNRNLPAIREKTGHDKIANDWTNILLDNGKVILGVKKLSKRSDITEKTKLYYELGYYSDYYQVNWVRTGKFSEIKNPIDFRDNDDRLENPKYIAHHNFVILIPMNLNNPIQCHVTN